jgi:hypothetical protein
MARTSKIAVSLPRRVLAVATSLTGFLVATISGAGSAAEPALPGNPAGLSGRWTAEYPSDGKKLIVQT